MNYRIALYSIVAAMTLSLVTTVAEAQDRPRVFVNPGHGGHDKDDRYEPIYVKGEGRRLDYYESESNLSTGLALAECLKAKGYDVIITRKDNHTADDLDLYEIVAMANASGADLFFAVHSNDTGSKPSQNWPLALYRGFTREPAVDGSDEIAEHVMRHLYANKVSWWNRESPKIAGDWSFYNWGYKVGLGVLTFNKLPGMLSEGAFHDFKTERLRYLNADYCWLEGWNQSLGIDDYFKRSSHYNRGTLAGIVYVDAPDLYDGYERRRPVNGANVVLADAQGRHVASLYTDRRDNGVYVFKNLKPGRYRVSTNIEGNPLSQDITVKANATVYANFHWTPPAPEPIVIDAGGQPADGYQIDDDLDFVPAGGK